MGNFTKQIRGLILDMDGVLWRGDKPIGDLDNLFSTIKQRGYKTVLATNNATRSVNQYLTKLREFGVHLDEWQIMTSGVATGHYLRDKFPANANIYVVGEEALIEMLEMRGFKLEKSSDRVVAVIVALDRTITYDKLRRATLLIRSGADFIATNPDLTFPEPVGLVPGAGAIVASIEAATGVSPTIIGKPSPNMYRVALERLGTQPEETLVVGDRLETDILGAQALGCQTALVLSGVTTMELARKWHPSPTVIKEDLSKLVESL